MGWQYNPKAWKELRELRGYALKDLSKGVYDSPNRETWAGIESGSHVPSMAKLCRALDFLNAKPSFLKELFKEIEE